LNFKNLSFLIDNEAILISEHLPPSWVSSSASYISWATVGLDIKWVVLPLVILKSLGNSIEEPLLSQGIVSPSSLPDVVGTVALSNSVEWKFWNQIEWSVNMETKVLIEPLGLWSLCFIKINNIPLLMSSSIVTPNTNLLAFLVFSSSNIKDLAWLPVDELSLLILENLEPSWVGWPDLHVIGSTSALDIPRLVVISSSDSQRLLMEVPDLSPSSIWSLDDKVSVIDEIKISVGW